MSELNESPVVTSTEAEPQTLTPSGDVVVAPEQVEQKQISPEDMCSQMLYVYGPRYKAILKKLSGRQKERLLYMLAMFPLQERVYAPTDPAEREAFNLGDRLLQAKFVLMTKVLSEKMEKEALQQEQASDETINDSQGENNG